MKRIEFRLEDPKYGFLSNFYPHELVDNTSVVWKTSEHYYQAMKTVSLSERAMVWAAPTARDAKKLGKDITIQGGWNNIKEDVMRTALALKFREGSAISQQLLNTMPHVLCEWAPWDDFLGSWKGRKREKQTWYLVNGTSFYS